MGMWVWSVVMQQHDVTNLMQSDQVSLKCMDGCAGGFSSCLQVWMPIGPIRMSHVT
jgi:hypothetical protein